MGYPSLNESFESPERLFVALTNFNSGYLIRRSTMAKGNNSQKKEVKKPKKDKKK
jgi:hypothetical protein